LSSTTAGAKILTPSCQFQFFEVKEENILIKYSNGLKFNHDWMLLCADTKSVHNRYSPDVTQQGIIGCKSVAKKAAPTLY